ncbi:hypothetical protein [Donghicola mangrovi]|uniref:Lipid/polyisoprenoid-binding YceI-like domain-containing protein n=1 Tax=Donghicola mangrovi TaxID=2729614 RepID=A0A850QEC7_9RHOB|nr:hypothetical protein [Donghicola mangrovi]NVO25298.1 hypothetical protein [Donghicola mangrovi]
MKMLPAAVLLAALPFAALADVNKETITPNNTLTAAPTAWLGQTPHFVVMGTVNGFDFDVQYLDLTKADIHNIEVKREYLIDGDARPYQEVDFELQAVIDGIAKKIEGKLNHADFLTLTLPATLELGPEENPAGQKTYTEFEFEWENDGISVNEEHGEWTGTAEIPYDDAFASAEPLADGLAGGYINAVHGDDHLVISYTFEIGEAEVEE